jgi:DUF1680 family protein
MMAQQTDPFSKIKTLPEKYQTLPLGELKPRGWLLQQIEENLAGFTGHLDSLAPDLILEDDIFGKNRLSRKVKSKDVGALGEAGDWQAQLLWWNSETQGNWWDGYIRSAVLTGDPYHLERVKKHIRYILSTQDADGYLGIYDAALRYHFDRENGELWAKTTLLRGMLAWYDYTKDQTVLTAIERAVQNVMDNWPAGAAHPFYSVNPNVGGLSHGLTFTDVLESLYRITKKESYLDYTLFCYKDFSAQILNEDAQYKKLLDRSLALKGHGVHTYEHLRSVAAAYYATGNQQLKIALRNILQKMVQTTTATGGPVGDEWIGGKKADATTSGYEYCSLQELMNGYADLLLKTGESTYGDKTERLFFNAAQGARHPERSCIAYLKSDNSYYMTGGLNGDTTAKHQTRYSYSPLHREAAVCCVPNAGRITPYFVQHMWLKGENSLVASLLGPCGLNTTINGEPVSIIEKTAYPYGNTILFEINAGKMPFTLKIRRPAWATKFSVSEKYTEENGFLIIPLNGGGKRSITVKFFPQVVVKQDINREFYFEYGALVLAHSIKGVATQTKVFPLPGFANLSYRPDHLVIYRYIPAKIMPEDKAKQLFTTALFNPITRRKETLLLQPAGGTILRQITFKPIRP